MCFALSTGAADGTLPGILDRGLPKPQVPNQHFRDAETAYEIDLIHQDIFTAESPHQASITKYQELFIVLFFNNSVKKRSECLYDSLAYVFVTSIVFAEH